MTGPTGNIRPASIIGFRVQCKSPLCMCHIWTPEAGVDTATRYALRPRILKLLAVNPGRRTVRCRKLNLWFPICKRRCGRCSIRSAHWQVQTPTPAQSAGAAAPAAFISLFVCQLQANCVIFSVDQGLEKCSGSACRRAIAITCAFHVVHHAGRKKDTKCQQYNNEYNN
jgi:hypothetical protein